jgi:hypothetical protein
MLVGCGHFEVTEAILASGARSRLRHLTNHAVPALALPGVFAAGQEIVSVGRLLNRKVPPANLGFGLPVLEKHVTYHGVSTANQRLGIRKSNLLFLHGLGERVRSRPMG